jgi:hypothetical protein
MKIERPLLKAFLDNVHKTRKKNYNREWLEVARKSNIKSTAERERERARAINRKNFWLNYKYPDDTFWYLRKAILPCNL